MQNQINEIEKIYKIKNGFCLIINIINFDEREDLRRDGSEESVKLVKEAFESYGFNVNHYNDLNDNEILELIDEQVTKEECELYDAFILYIHTHGIADTILCKNSFERNKNGQSVLTKCIHFHQIINIFKDDNCEALKNKPKIVIFDCCRDGNEEIELIL